jgi:mycothiol synthase
MKFRSYNNEEDYWRIRNFLREVFLLNERLEHSWHVARLDYWRWHYILNLQVCESIEKIISIWETEDSQIAGVLHPIGQGEIRLHVHPQFRSHALENEMLRQAEEQLPEQMENGQRVLYLPVFNHDVVRQEILIQRGYLKGQGLGHHWWRDLDGSIPETPRPSGYTIRSMGLIDEHPARSWASWRAFHSDEPHEAYDGDWSWYQNVQSAPLYRRDLDIVAVTQQNEIAAFCTIYYDDTTRSAVSVLVGTAAEHWRRGLGKAVMLEGMRRLKVMGCTRIFATAYDPPAYALYSSVMQSMQISETWYKEIL